MINDDAAKFLVDLLNGIKVKDLSSHIRQYFSEDIVGHYKDQDFNFIKLSEQIQVISGFIEKFYFEIDDLVVIDNLIISVIRFTWVHSKDKSYCEAILNLVFRVEVKKVQEVWLMVDQKTQLSTEQEQNFQQIIKRFEINEKDKAEFLRRLAANQALYQDQKKLLTDSEKECLFYYLNGFSSKEAARAMGLSYRTVEVYLAAIKARYNCSTKMELRRKLFPHETSSWGESK